MERLIRRKKTFHLTFGWDQKSFCGLSSSDLGRQRVFWMARCCLWRAYCDWFNMEKSLLDNLLELKTVSTADSRIVRWPNSTWQGKITLAYLDKNRQYWCSRMFKGSINKQDQQTHLAVRYLWVFRCIQVLLQVYAWAPPIWLALLLWMLQSLRRNEPLSWALQPATWWNFQHVISEMSWNLKWSDLIHTYFMCNILSYRYEYVYVHVYMCVYYVYSLSMCPWFCDRLQRSLKQFETL